MNNSHFRNLLGTQKNGTFEPPQDGSKKSMLGSRARSSVSMTPRSLGGHSRSKEFARQVSDHQNESRGEPPAKKFKSSAAPKGTKLASGYTDRSSERRVENVDDSQNDKAKRLKSLEEMLKLQQIDQQTFDKLQDQLGVGGETSTTHLVKGLDWKLLERVRRGEDINKVSEASSNPVQEPDVDEELEKALEKEVVPQARRQSADVQTVVAIEEQPQPTTRDEILRRLKQSRLASSTVNAPSTTAAPVLGDKFKKFGEASSKSGKKKFIEIVDGRRREVLILTDKEGNTKRKTRWLDPEGVTVESTQNEAWGGDVSSEIAARQKAFEDEQKKKAAEEEEDTNAIFPDVGEYDLLAGIGSDSSENESELSDDERKIRPEKQRDGGTLASPSSTSEQATELQKPSLGQRRNYFSTNNKSISSEEASETNSSQITQDPTILAALKRAAQIRQNNPSDQSSNNDNYGQVDAEQDSKGQAFLAKLKERDRQDALDMDMGFGDSRLGDEDEEDDGAPLASWNDEQGADGAATERKAGGARKRGPKKRKGNKDNVQDIMSVLEGRKQK